jgi:hypothetical protein
VAGGEPALRNEGGAGINGEFTYAPRPRHILCQVEVVGASCTRRFRNPGCQIEGTGVEYRKLPVEQIDQLRAVLKICNRGANVA